MPPADAEKKILAGLTDAQREAVTYGEGPLLVVAGAGSGKTRVITQRIAWLIHGGVPPERVIAITFTNKAADEMRRRVVALVGSSVYVSTFHSFCARLLRRDIARVGMDSNFTIYDRSDSIRVLRNVLRERKLDDSTFTPAGLLEYISARKDRIMDPAESRQKALGYFGRTQADLFAAYQERLAASNALDFDDLLLKPLEVFRSSPEVLQHYRDRFVHVLVDEYQDTNLPQHLLARALQGKHRNITAVGDPDQMIYTWRGARMENLMEFEQDFPGTHVVMLERNYRSSANILGASDAVIRHNRYRRDKTLWTERQGGVAVEVRQFRDSYEEGRWVAERTAELLQEGVRPTEIAVFYRTKQQSVPLEAAFAERTLAHQVVDSTGFFDRRGVKDLLGYLHLLVNPKNEIACLRVINSPTRGIGAKTVQKLQAAAARRGCSVMEVACEADDVEALSGRAGKAVGAFARLFRDLMSLQPERVEDLLRRVTDRVDYVNRQRAEDREAAEDVLNLLFGYAREYDRRFPEGGLIGFLEQAALVSDVDGWKAEGDAVPFMTLHSAKGLEFDVVFTIGVEEDILPHRRAVEERLYGTEEEALEEERRLFYVGMTRARHRLFITYADTHMARGRERSMLPSRFLEELPRDNIEWHRRPSGLPAASGGYGEQLEFILKRKRISLTILDGAAGDRLAPGVRVSHTQFGEGEIIEVTMLAQRLMIRVNFFGKGPMTILLAPEDVALADP